MQQLGHCAWSCGCGHGAHALEHLLWILRTNSDYGLAWPDPAESCRAATLDSICHDTVVGHADGETRRAAAIAFREICFFRRYARGDNVKVRVRDAAQCISQELVQLCAASDSGSARA